MSLIKLREERVLLLFLMEQFKLLFETWCPMTLPVRNHGKTLATAHILFRICNNVVCYAV